MQSEWILVVEDEVNLRDSAGDVLIDEGYTVARVSTLDAARGKLALEQFACIVVDLGLPDGTGDVLLREMSKQPDAPAAVVISASPAAVDVARHYGVLHLMKPFELEVLLAAVKVAISQRMRPSVRTAREAPTVRMRPVR